MYIYVSNATPNIDVFWDNLQVTHVRGAVLEENAYYPFGLLQAGISSKAAGKLENKKKFVGQEFDSEFDLNWYQFRYRNHDPQIGRFVQIDPLASKYVYNSTYAYAENRVINGIDLEGLEFFGTTGAWLRPVTTVTFESNNIIARPVIETMVEVGAKTSEIAGKTAEIGTKTPKIEQHHLIPKEFKADPIVQAGRKGGFKFEGAENKIPLEKYSKATGEGQHGNHPNYSSEIAQKFSQFKEDNPGFTSEQAVQFLRNTVSDMKTEIMNNSGTKINNIFGRQNIITPAADGIKVGIPAPFDPTKIIKRVEQTSHFPKDLL